VVFLDKAIPDALAYYHFLNLPENDKLMEELRNVSY
jgi:predicted ATPase